MVAIERVCDIMLFDEEKKADEGINVSSFAGDICFEKVSFAYDSDAILNNLSFQIKRGEHVAIVGKSGEGKSTIVNLLCGFYLKNDGKISIDNQDIEKYSLACLRERMGVVAQQSVLFDNTVRYNIVFSNDKARDAEIWNVLKKVGLYEDIKDCQGELDAIIGEKGRQLSGGQKQRLVIARMLLKNPDVLILDEATSAIDGDSEARIGEIIKNDYREKTVISIAHRFSTILQADRILVLDQGGIIAQGSHEELYMSCDIYKKLYDNAKGIE